MTTRHGTRLPTCLAQATARAARRVSGWPNHSAPSTTVQMGIVKLRMAARPEASSCTPRMENRCQPRMLGAARSSTGHQLARGGFIATPLALHQVSIPSAPALMAVAGKYSGESSRKKNFIIGQFTPRQSVNKASRNKARGLSAGALCSGGSRQPVFVVSGAS